MFGTTIYYFLNAALFINMYKGIYSSKTKNNF